jgi:hypothetical protein
MVPGLKRPEFRGDVKQFAYEIVEIRGEFDDEFGTLFRRKRGGVFTRGGQAGAEFRRQVCEKKTASSLTRLSRT